MIEISFEDCVRQYADTLYRLALNYLKNAADAEDAVQNTYLRFLKCNKSFESESHCKYYLIRICINECKRTMLHPFYNQTEDIAVFSDKLFFENPKDNELLASVMALPAKYRVVIYLYYYEGYSVTEIAALLKKNPATVRTQMKRAREKLKAEMEE